MAYKFLGIILTLALLLSLHTNSAVASHKSGFAFYTWAGWIVYYTTTNTDGIEIIHAAWKGVENFRDMSLPQIDVEYWVDPPPGGGMGAYYLVDQIGSQAINEPCSPISNIPISEPGGNYGFSLQQEFRTITSTCGSPPQQHL